MRSDLQRMVYALGLSDGVALCGRTSDVPAVLADAKGFLMSSDYEGMPNALMEAMAVGLPCVVTDCPCGGPGELIADGTNGVLVPVGNSRAMADQIKRLLVEDNVGDVVPAMTRLFLDEAGKLYAETWLVVQEIGLAFDLDSRKPGEEYGLVVEIQRHPLVADDDALARVAVQHGYTVLGARLDLCNEDLLGVDDAAAVFDVLDALGILAEGRVPTLEDIMKSYLESCVDVPAGGWGTFAER